MISEGLPEIQKSGAGMAAKTSAKFWQPDLNEEEEELRKKFPYLRIRDIVNRHEGVANIPTTAYKAYNSTSS
jgi:hypothetical protein